MYGIGAPPFSYPVYDGGIYPEGSHGIPIIPPPMPQSQTADNIRDMLEDITKELECDSQFSNVTPCRNDLEPEDYMVLEHCKAISMSAEQAKVLEKITTMCESSLKSVSDSLLREAALEANRTDLVEMLDDAKNNNKVRILQRKVEISDQQKKAKEELNKLRVINRVFRVGKIAMDTLLTDEMVSELVLFTQYVPTRSLLAKITKLFPSCLDKSLNLGVENCGDSILISGEFLNEKVACKIHLTSRSANSCENLDKEKWLGLENMQMCLQRVRRVNFWNEVIVRLSPIMDQITRLFLWLRSEEGNKLQYFSEWQVILTIYFAMGSCNTAMLGPVDCIRRVSEFLSSTFLFTTALKDPVESEPTDYLESVTTQELEELAAWSGRILRLAAFGLISDFLPVSLEPEESDTAEIEKVDIEQLEVTE